MKLATLLVFLALPTAARATPRLPRAVEDQLGLGYRIQCSLCHINGKTGAGTAITPFAVSATARGMDSRDTTALATALTQLRADGVDSDGDGVSDIAELIAGTDPNAAGPSSLLQRTDPAYGCGSVRTPAPLSLLLVFAWALAIALRRRLRAAL